MRTGSLDDACTPDRVLHRALHDRLVQVVAPRVRIFPSQGRRKLHLAGAGREVAEMLLADALQSRRALGATAVVSRTNGRAHTVEQSWFRGAAWIGFAEVQCEAR